MKKILLIIFLTLTAYAASADSDPLMEYMWKNRLVVYSIPESELNNHDILEKAIQQSAEIKDRDMLFIDLNGRDTGALFTELKPEEREQLKKAYKISEDQAVFMLVGKDGGEKERLTGNLDLEYFFSKIDAMPMRIEEMGE